MKKNKIEPIENEYEITGKLLNKENNRETKVKLKLTQDEYNQYTSIHDKDVSTKFIENLIQQKNLIKKSLKEQKINLFGSEKFSNKVKAWISNKNETIETIFDLSNDEVDFCEKLSTEEEKKDYIRNLALQKGIMNKLHEEGAKKWPEFYL
ncbi:hypothetical protein ACAW74_06440 [Fibrella sp. WM1]|uniref:hypothetical protein n=1 Tax=Fibrella musci TaxID=3242485 RepID=UPI003522F4ED